MNRWLRRVRGAVGMGLTWAVGWALVGLMIGLTSRLLPGLPWWNSFFRFFDAPLPALAVPGFVGGALFSVVLGIAGRRRRFSELSLPRFAAWGALGGLLLGLVPATMVTLGLATLAPGLDLWRLTGIISVPCTLLSAASASGQLLLARKAEKRDAALATERMRI
ncbi:MAG TPA: hypothetical protein VFT29_14430 [Gemmatimonadaceae bacterium]|nr:hypothetical protein [Gemmatimonadaceae bacterium]